MRCESEKWIIFQTIKFCAFRIFDANFLTETVTKLHSREKGMVIKSDGQKS